MKEKGTLVAIALIVALVFSCMTPRQARAFDVGQAAIIGGGVIGGLIVIALVATALTRTKRAWLVEPPPGAETNRLGSQPGVRYFIQCRPEGGTVQLVCW